MHAPQRRVLPSRCEAMIASVIACHRPSRGKNTKNEKKARSMKEHLVPVEKSEHNRKSQILKLAATSPVRPTASPPPPQALQKLVQTTRARGKIGVSTTGASDDAHAHGHAHDALLATPQNGESTDEAASEGAAGGGGGGNRERGGSSHCTSRGLAEEVCLCFCVVRWPRLWDVRVCAHGRLSSLLQYIRIVYCTARP